MSCSRFGLLALCSLILGVMASSGAAHAEVGAQWLLTEKEPGTNPVPFLEAEVDVKKDSSVYVLHTEILKIKTLFLCTDIKVKGTAKLIANGGISAGQILFGGCTTDLNGIANANCTPKDAADGAGTVVTRFLDFLLGLHNGLDILKLLPVEPGPIAIIEMGAACPIGTKVPIIGEVALEDCEGGALQHLVEHLIETLDSLTQLWTISKTQEHIATFLGSSLGFLKGEDIGLKVSADPA